LITGDTLFTGDKNLPGLAFDFLDPRQVGIGRCKHNHFATTGRQDIGNREAETAADDSDIRLGGQSLR